MYYYQNWKKIKHNTWGESNATNSADAMFEILRKPVDFCTPFSCQKMLFVFRKNICLWEQTTSG